MRRQLPEQRPFLDDSMAHSVWRTPLPPKSKSRSGCIRRRTTTSYAWLPPSTNEFRRRLFFRQLVDWVRERLDLNRVVGLGSLLGRSTVYVALAFLTDAQRNPPTPGRLRRQRRHPQGHAERHARRAVWPPHQLAVWTASPPRRGRPSDHDRPKRRVRAGGVDGRQTHADADQRGISVLSCVRDRWT